MRGWGASVGTTLTSLITTLITFSFHGLVSAITQAGVFWLYSALTALGVFFTLFCVPETKGKSLEEITERFKRSGQRSPGSHRDEGKAGTGEKREQTDESGPPVSGLMNDSGEKRRGGNRALSEGTQCDRL